MMMQPRPPHTADRLLKWFCAPHLLEEIQGDLHERFSQDVEAFGEKAAQRKYYRSVIGFFRPFAIKRKKETYYSKPVNSTDMLRSYFKIAFRNLAKNKVYASINIVGLAIGLAAAMLILLYTKDEISYDQFHAQNPNIYRIVNRWTNPDGSLKNADGNTGSLPGPRFKDKIPEIEAFVRVRSDFRNIKMGTEIKSQELLYADAGFFSMFSFPLSAGNPATALQKPNSAVISEELAEKYFGTTDVLGKTLEMLEDGKPAPVLITGVSKKCPQNSTLKFDLLLPMQVSQEEIQNKENWFSFYLNTFVLVHPASDIAKVEAKMKQIYEADARDAIKLMLEKYDVKESAAYLLQPYTDIHLNTQYQASNGLSDASNPMFSYILTGISIFILLIACINFVNLTVSRSLKRAKEIGLRKVVGGDRSQLIFQFLGESFGLCFLAFALAVGLVNMILPTFNQLSNKALSFSYLLDIQLIIGYVAIFLVTSLMAGFYPAYILSGFDPVQTLYSRFTLSGKNYLQKGLLTLQFGLASFLIIATLTIYSQFNYLTNKELGYDDKNLVMVDKWRLSRNEARLFKNELLKNPDILGYAPKNGGGWGTVAKINGDTQINFSYETVDAEFLPMLKIPVIQGRNFSADFPGDSSQSVIVNESFVKKAGWKNPVGQDVRFFVGESDQVYKVIGVTKDYHYDALNQKIGSQLFTMKSQNEYGVSYIKIKPNTEQSSLAYIEKTFKKLFPVHSYSYRFKDVENLKNYESEAKWKQILLFGTLLTIFISCMGLFGLATLSAERRTKEIGIRKVLGASIGSIVQLLSTDFLKLVSFSLVVAFPLAYYATQQWLSNYPYQVPFNVWIFVLTAVATIGLVLLTVGYQSVRAALMNPVKTLKSE